jgi:hypothetical protein
LEYVRKLNFVIESTADSSLVDDFTCEKCTTGYQKAGYIRLLIVPEARAHKVNWQDAVKKGEEGAVVAMVINIDRKTLPEIELPPGGVAYAWVGQIDASGNRGFGVYRINKTGMRVGEPWWVTSTLLHCNHKEHDTPAVKRHHEAKPGDEPCTPIAPAASSASSQNVRLASTSWAHFIAPAKGGGSLWVSCTGGCCEVVPN